MDHHHLELGQHSPAASGLSLWIERSTKRDGTFLIDVMKDGAPATPGAIVLTSEQRFQLIDYLLDDDFTSVQA